MVVFEVAEFVSVIKINVAPFLVALGPIFAQTLGITRQWWVEQPQRRDVSIMFLVEFYVRIGHFCKNFGNVQVLQNAFTAGIFCVNQSNSLDLVETAVIRVSEVAELESVLKTEVAQFLVALSPIITQNLGITREQWVV